MSTTTTTALARGPTQPSTRGRRPWRASRGPRGGAHSRRSPGDAAGCASSTPAPLQVEEEGDVGG
eukprot:5061446-Pyramimonas_sp.AAC.1